jgi:hypothetical protein
MRISRSIYGGGKAVVAGKKRKKYQISDFRYGRVKKAFEVE